MLPWFLVAAMSTALLYHFKVIGGMSDEDQIGRAYKYALTHETDVTVLTTFAYKLQAAGYEAQANALTAKIARLNIETVHINPGSIHMVQR